MREVRDAAAIERASSIVANVGTVALQEAAKRTADVPGNTKPVYFRGALVRNK